MEERDKVLIEKYIAGELSITDRHEVEQRLKDDSIFKQEFEEYMLTMDALKIAQREELRERFRKRDKILDRRDSGFLHRPKSLWLLAAIVTGVVLLSWLAYYGFKQPAEEEIFTKQDSSRLEQTIEHLPDTSRKLEIQTPQDIGNRPRPKDLPSKKGEEYFAANFEPYEDESFDPVSRGTDDAKPIDQFQTHYWNKEYSKAVDVFNQLSDEYQQNDNLRFLYANALMGAGKVGTAESELTEILQNQKSVYLTESLFYLALTQIYRGEFPGAKYNLETYLQKPDAKQKSAAEKILKEMK